MVMKAIARAVENACRPPAASAEHSLVRSGSSVASFVGPPEPSVDAVRDAIQPAADTGSGQALCMARILLWTSEELLSDAGEAVTKIHEVFRIPLFFLNVPQDDPRRSVDFMVFEGPAGTAMMPSKATYASFLLQNYARVAVTSKSGTSSAYNYYNGSWGVMTLMMMTGNMTPF